MLNKAVFRPFIENVYFQRGEKKTTSVTMRYIQEDKKLQIELASEKGLYISHEHYCLENDISESDYHCITVSYEEFCNKIGALKAKHPLSLSFHSTFLLIKEDLNDGADAIVHKLSSTELCNNAKMITPKELSNEIDLDSNDLQNVRYLSSLKLDIEAVPQFGNVTMRQNRLNQLLFIGTAGASLHVCHVSTSEMPEKMLEYSFPAVYLKNIVNVISEYGTTLMVGYNENNVPIIRFSSIDTLFQVTASEVSPNSSIYSNSLSDLLKLVEKPDENKTMLSSFLENEQELELIENNEKAYRNKNKCDKWCCRFDINTKDEIITLVCDPKTHYTYEMTLKGAEGNQYTISYFDFMTLIDEASSHTVYFNENEKAFVFMKENRCVITPK